MRKKRQYEEVLEEIGYRLSLIREALGYSVKDMAENLGINYERYIVCH